MTNTDWHAPPALLAQFATDPAGVDDMTAASVEAHLVACAECRAGLTAAADPGLVGTSWAAVADAIDRPRRTVAERVWHLLGMDSGTARILAATPALRAAGLLAVALLATAAALLSRSADGEGPFLVLAPLVPLVAVAAVFAPTADPAGEAGVATPVHGFGLVVRRAVAILGVTFAVLGVSALATPHLGPSAALWVLPALALTLGSLALGSWMRIEVAVTTLAGGWLLVVGAAWWVDGHHGPVLDSRTFSAAGQLLALAVAVAAGAVVMARRDRFATLEVFR